MSILEILTWHVVQLKASSARFRSTCRILDFSGANCPCPRYVMVRYKFDVGVDDTRKEAFCAAAADWRTHTCIAVVEDDNAETCRPSRPDGG